MGGSLESFYWTFGTDDFHVIVDLPSVFNDYVLALIEAADDVLLVGGSSRMCAVQAAVTACFDPTLFEPVDAVSVPVHTNGATLSIGGDDDDVDVPPFMRR